MTCCRLHDLMGREGAQGKAAPSPSLCKSHSAPETFSCTKSPFSYQMMTLETMLWDRDEESGKYSTGT